MCAEIRSKYAEFPVENERIPQVTYSYSSFTPQQWTVSLHVMHVPSRQKPTVTPSQSMGGHPSGASHTHSLFCPCFPSSSLPHAAPPHIARNPTIP